MKGQKVTSLDFADPEFSLATVQPHSLGQIYKQTSVALFQSHVSQNCRPGARFGGLVVVCQPLGLRKGEKRGSLGKYVARWVRPMTEGEEATDVRGFVQAVSGGAPGKVLCHS